MSTATRSAAQRAHVLVAVKKLHAAKTRLSGVFDASDRSDLVLSMLHDTLAVVSDVDSVAGVTVVTPDLAVARLARSIGAGVYADPVHELTSYRPEVAEAEHSLNAALAAAAEHIRRSERLVDVVALQADLPSLREGEFGEALAAARFGGRSVVIDHHGTGTAALFSCDPSIPLDPRFGPGSARRHLDSGARPLEGHWPGLRTDVDTAEDLDAARALGVGPATRAALEALAPTTHSHCRNG
ncbi:2-phospho-L-lactate guanylyltransferase [Rhodococcus sp. WMMA185]|uniref:2-phospho-L-lactate guanylyltransferase n=1 Tax=Rhodococcus sp. WMMA185 TaxID=679318 RepID=UPI000878FDAC|nr:2-phospho-L-lactate guanylyltransferase [Rhodococcus sp. WMMA185]AOW94465.1 2-phospho-L-lactate guanylyltransferase [Rhodococcus sp. WMMA185]